MSQQNTERIPNNHREIVNSWERAGYRKCAACVTFVHSRGTWSCKRDDCPQRAQAQPAAVLTG